MSNRQLVRVTAHLQPHDLVLHGLPRCCDPSCPLEVGALQPWGCSGVPVSPWALGSAE